MTPEQRLRFITSVEKAGYGIEATEDRNGDMMILTVWGAIGHVARSMGYRRYDWEDLAKQFHAFQHQGSKRYRTRKAAA